MNWAEDRRPARFGAAVWAQAPEVEHAYRASGTLCGVTPVVAYRHRFDPEREPGCAECRRLAAAAPMQPGSRERLHDLVAAAEGPLREQLRAALRDGAVVRFWMSAPARRLAEHHARVDAGAAVRAALDVDGSVGLARVEAGPWTFVVVFPRQGRPVIGRAGSAAGEVGFQAEA